MSVRPLAVSTWSFHNAIFGGHLTPAGALATAARMGFVAVEFNDRLATGARPGLKMRARRLTRSVVLRYLPWLLPRLPQRHHPRHYDPAVVAHIARAATEAGVRIVSWTMDTDLTVSGNGLDAQKGYWERGLETASRLGAEVVRVTTGGTATAGGAERKAVLGKAASALAALTQRAEQAGIAIAVENHWGLSADPSQLAALIQSVGAPRERLGVCLDFGNFPTGRELEGIRLLAPLANHVHAKSYSFDADGEEQRLPYREILGLLAQANYRGWIVVEYEGDGEPESGIHATRALIERHRAIP